MLHENGVIAVPTETVYGLAGNALSKLSTGKIFSIKGRPLIDPLIVHFKDLQSAETHITASKRLHRLAEAFWPGPLTVVVPKKESIPDIVTAGFPSVAIRVPQHPVFQSVLNCVNFPLAAPSANPFGYVSPTLAEHVQNTLGDKIDAILDGGPCEFGLESTIIDLRNTESPVILRHGPITPEQIENVLGVTLTTPENTVCENVAQVAPGRLTKHYSPHAQMVLHERGELQEIDPKVLPLPETTAFVCSRKPDWYTHQPNIFWLSETGDLETVASNLFKLVYKLDQLEFKEIRIEKVIEAGLGRAINDRLRRAAAKNSP